MLTQYNASDQVERRPLARASQRSAGRRVQTPRATVLNMSKLGASKTRHACTFVIGHYGPRRMRNCALRAPRSHPAARGGSRAGGARTTACSCAATTTKEIPLIRGGRSMRLSAPCHRPPRSSLSSSPEDRTGSTCVAVLAVLAVRLRAHVVDLGGGERRLGVPVVVAHAPPALRDAADPLAALRHLPVREALGALVQVACGKGEKRRSLVAPSCASWLCVRVTI